MENGSPTRQDRIFDVIVRSYIDTAEPVGSRTISRHSDLGLSPASIRNVMADLEERGFLKQPHTSAGRVPTDRGYRYWVDCLMRRETLTPDEKAAIHEQISRVRTIEALAERVSRVISELTDNAALLYVKNLKRVSFLNRLLEELVASEQLEQYFEEEPELFIEGAFRIFEHPEFQDLAKIRGLLRAFEEKLSFLDIFVRDLEAEGVHVHIGSENGEDGLGDVSLVVKDWYVGQTPIGSIAVVGPTRMRYARVVSVVDFVADTVTEAVKKF